VLAVEITFDIHLVKLVFEKSFECMRIETSFENFTKQVVMGMLGKLFRK
jgi:hypothetical protein